MTRIARKNESPRGRIAALAVLVALAAWGGAAWAQGAGRAKAKEQKVNVYMFSEYIAPEIPKEFEKLTGIKVRIDVYEADEEMVAKMQAAGGVNYYDIVVVTGYMVPTMRKLNLIQPLDLSKIPNKANVDEQFLNPPYDQGNKYSLPYQWGAVGLIYRADRAPNFEPTWQSLFDEAKQPGPFVMMDEMRSMMAIALIAQGSPVNSTDVAQLKAAGELLLKAKSSKKCLGFDGGVAGKNKVVAGDATMAVVYNGDAVRGMGEDKNVRFCVPVEGTTVWMDCMVIPSKAPNAENAHKFINTILDAKVGAQLSNFNRYATPNKASMPFIAPKDKADPAIYPTPEQRKKMWFVKDMAETMPLYDEIWTTVKSR